MCYTRSSERVSIKVKPLPTEGKPASFSGAVGNFDVHTSVEGTSFPVNQPFSLKVRFEGSGNAKTIELPSLNLPAGTEVYDTKNDSKFFKNGKSYKEFEVLIIPRQEGQITIPAMSFSMFDPRQGKYIVKNTEAIPVKVVANPNGGNISASRLNTDKDANKRVEKKNELPDVLVSWDSSATSSVMNRFSFWILIYVLIGAALAVKGRKELAGGQKKRDLKLLVQKRFKTVSDFVEKGDWRAAGTEMTNICYVVLGELAGQSGANVEISKLLDLAPPSLRRELGVELSQMIELCQILSFAPEAVVGSLKEKSVLKKNADQAQKTLLKALNLAENNSKI